LNWYGPALRAVQPCVQVVTLRPRPQGKPRSSGAPARKRAVTLRSGVTLNSAPLAVDMMQSAAKGLVVFVVAATISGCSSHMYYWEAKVYGDAVAEELVRLGACSNRQACSSNQMVLWQGDGWKIGPFRGGGVSVEVYRVLDVRVAEALVERCRQIHLQSPAVPVSIVVHSNAHISNLHPGTPVILKRARFP